MRKLWMAIQNLFWGKHLGKTEFRWGNKTNFFFFETMNWEKMAFNGHLKIWTLVANYRMILTDEVASKMVIIPIWYRIEHV